MVMEFKLIGYFLVPSLSVSSSIPSFHSRLWVSLPHYSDSSTFLPTLPTSCGSLLVSSVYAPLVVGCASAELNNHMALLAVSHLEPTKTDNKQNIPDTCHHFLEWQGRAFTMGCKYSGTVCDITISRRRQPAGKLISSCEL